MAGMGVGQQDQSAWPTALFPVGWTRWVGGLLYHNCVSIFRDPGEADGGWTTRLLVGMWQSEIARR